MPLLTDPSCSVFHTYEVVKHWEHLCQRSFVGQAGQLRYKHLFSFLSNNANVETLLEMALF